MGGWSKFEKAVAGNVWGSNSVQQSNFMMNKITRNLMFIRSDIDPGMGSVGNFELTNETY